MKSKLSALGKILRPSLYILYWMSFLSRRDHHLWSFGGDYHSFSNGKYLAKYIREYHNHVKIVWLVRSHIDLEKIKRDGFEAYHHWSWKGIKHSLRAKYQFLNSYVFDINYWLSGGSIITNLWHGVPLKKLNTDIKTGPSARIFNPRYVPKSLARIFILRLKSPHYFIVTSDLTKDLFAKSFNVKKENCIMTGYPRNDAFFNVPWSKDMEVDIFTQVRSMGSSSSKMIFYMPTWRDTGNDFLGEAGIEINSLNEILVKKEHHFFIKLHPLTKVDVSDFEGFSNIHLLQGSLDVYPILRKVDLLITDYSSIYIDFLLTDNPIIFFPFDMEKYVSNDRDLYFEYEKVTPGPKAYNFDQLVDLLGRFDINSNAYKEEYPYNDVKRMFWKYHDGRASERIFNFFQDRSTV